MLERLIKLLGPNREAKTVEPAWVADHAVWDKAKKAVKPGASKADEPYAVVTSVYKKMGGKIKKKTEAKSAKHPLYAAMETLAPKGHKQADVSSAQPTAVLAGDGKKKESAGGKGTIGKFKETCRFVETTSRGDPNPKAQNRFEVVLLQEGLGNLNDLFYYTREALESAIPVFEGKKIYADHPSQVEEETRPERSVRDVLGHFENLRVMESEEGRASLVGDVCVLDEPDYAWARGMMRHSVEYSKKYPDQEFIGLSINANGESTEKNASDLMADIPDSAKMKVQKAIDAGAETLRAVSKITEAVSCDLVTEAGAGGKILALIEREKNMGKKKVQEADKSKQLVAEAAKDKQLVAEAEDEAGDKADGDGGADDGHDDADKDKALIKSMLDKHLGEGAYGEADMEAGAKALKCAFGHTKDKEEAMQMAGHAMKMAKLMHAESEESEAENESETESEAETESEKKESETKESAKAKPVKESDSVMKLKGENARLKESLLKREIQDHVDGLLAKSGIPRALTKEFKESLGEPRSKADVDRAWKQFNIGYKANRSEADDDLFVEMEKGAPLIESAKNKAMDLGDCVD